MARESLGYPGLRWFLECYFWSKRNEVTQQSDGKLDNNPTKSWITIRPKAESLSDQGLDNSRTKSRLYQVRVGADIGRKCLKCQRMMLLTRDVFRRKVKEFVSKSD